MKKFLVLSIAVFVTVSSALSQSGCPGFRTFTQGGWGSTPSGNNPGTLLNNNFTALFPAPDYLTIGCSTGNKLRLTTPNAVRAFLPNGTTPALLPNGTIVNPTKNNFSNVFAGQLVALTINLRFDNALVNFAPSNQNLKNLVISTGPFIGKTVQFLFDEANKRIGGCPAFNATLSQYVTAIDNVNKSYDNGVINGSFLVCPLVANCSTTQANCFGTSTGTMSVSISGGMAPYNYLWSGGEAGNSSSALGLAAGTYTVTITDASLQTASATCTVGQPTQLIASASISQDILCNGGTTSVIVAASGGTPSYNGVGNFSVNAGSYNYSVTDSKGCIATTNISVAEPELLAVEIEVEQRVSCTNECNGVVFSSISGGTGSYNLTWSNGETTDFISGLCPGNYSLSVADGNGCNANSELAVLDNPSPILSAILESVEDENCLDNVCNGSITVQISGGEPGYNYQWVDGPSGVTDGEVNLTEICEGFYQLNVTDSRGCSINVWDGFISCRPFVSEDCGVHKTFTQGGWGASPNGNNPGVYLHNNFDSAFPNGLTIGCDDNSLTFYSAQEITDFLPEGGTPDALPNLSVLTGQLVAASLNVGFDAFDSDFASSQVQLGNMYTHVQEFEGMTLYDILSVANDVIGGCASDFSYPALNSVLTIINENFDNGNQDNGNLSCELPDASDRMKFIHDNASSESNFNFDFNIFPNPAEGITHIQLDSNVSDAFQISLFSITGDLMKKNSVILQEGSSIIELDLTNLPTMIYLLQVSNEKVTVSKKVQVR